MNSLDAVTAVTSSVITSGLLYAGTRYVAKSSKKVSETQASVESRRVSISEFEMFKTAYNEQMDRLETRYEKQEAKVSRLEALLKLALRHIRDLRIDLRSHAVTPTAPPPDIERLLWSLEADNFDSEVARDNP